MRYPDGHCQACGEPLRLVPCFNCGQRAEMARHDPAAIDADATHSEP